MNDRTTQIGVGLITIDDRFHFIGHRPVERIARLRAIKSYDENVVACFGFDKAHEKRLSELERVSIIDRVCPAGNLTIGVGGNLLGRRLR